MPSIHKIEHKHCYNILLLRSEIAFDIHFFTYKTAKISFAEVKDKYKKEVVIGKDNTDWLDRHITSAIAKVKQAIAFAVPRASRMPSDEILVSPSQFNIQLAFDDSWDGEPQTLCDLIHKFIVDQCIADWALTALPNMHDRLQQIADLSLVAIHDNACYTY